MANKEIRVNLAYWYGPIYRSPETGYWSRKISATPSPDSPYIGECVEEEVGFRPHVYGVDVAMPLFGTLAEAGEAVALVAVKARRDGKIAACVSCGYKVQPGIVQCGPCSPEYVPLASKAASRFLEGELTFDQYMIVS